VRDVCGEAVEAARGAGAEYADARAVLRREQSVATKNGAVDAVSDVESEGVGVRVLVDGAWGFACDPRLTTEGARAAATRAAEFARASGGASRRELAPVEPRQATYRTAVEIDPFSVSIADKIELCLRAEAGLHGPEVKVAEAFARALREHKVLVTSDGVDVEQELVECGAGIDATAIGEGLSQIRSYPSAHGGSSAQAGWEYVVDLDLEGEAPRVAEQAAALLRAPECPAGVTDIVIDAEQMQLQVHESVGHPTELDRVLGSEAAYAGTSFLKPGDLGSLRYGSELMNITADPTTRLGLGTFGFDDEGVAAVPQPIVREGVLVGWMGSREAGFPGSMRADGWSRMPLVRMTNLHLEPGDGTLEVLLADVREGLYLETNKSWSIDDKRLNFQFGTQVAWEIRDGALGRLVRDATYTGITPQFWGSLDAVGGRDVWRLQGLTNCGKGQPGQSAHVSHGAAPARFRGVQVGVAA
jgi:TldD protein